MVPSMSEMTIWAVLFHRKMREEQVPPLSVRNLTLFGPSRNDNEANTLDDNRRDFMYTLRLLGSINETAGLEGSVLTLTGSADEGGTGTASSWSLGSSEISPSSPSI